MNKLLSVALLSSLLLSRTVLADPSVSFPKGDAAWTADFTQSPTANAMSDIGGKKHATKAEITQINKIRKVEVTWDDGSITQLWKVPSMPVDFVEDPQNGAVDPNVNASRNQGVIKFKIPYDDSAFLWVGPATLKEKDPVSYLGKQCYHFMGQVTFLPNVPPQTWEAWVDSKTQLPVALNTGAFVVSFTFAEKPPTGPLEMPDKFKKEIEYYKILTGYR